MGGEFDALGDVVTGGLLAHAVEPRAGEASADGHTHEKSCLNCGTPLTGPYCSACGQKNVIVNHFFCNSFGRRPPLFRHIVIT